MRWVTTKRADGRRGLVAALFVVFVATACSSGSGSSKPDADAPDTRAAAGGANGTVELDGTGAFAQPMPGLSIEERRAFQVGNSFFNQNWVTAPSSTTGRDGLGPTFNAQACSSCHEFDGRGEPPANVDDPTRGLLLRLSVRRPDGTLVPDPRYGDQLQDRGILGVDAEGRIVITYTDVTGKYGDGTTYTLQAPHYAIDQLAYGPLGGDLLISPRVAPAVFGAGLLEAVPAEQIESRVDPDDKDGDGVSGRANYARTANGDRVLGRFGWKAAVASVPDQVLNAFHGDIGITSAAHPEQNCTSVQAACLAAPDGGTPELEGKRLERVVFYNRTLAVPARRDVGADNTDAGERTFAQLGCTSCHTGELRTGAKASVPALENQTIHPYTDLLLHDMGDGLADNRPDGDANGREWRTAPLWGIGLVEPVNGHTRFLHDGRARSLEEAILWHGGEAERAQRAFLALPESDRRQLITFLESL